MVGSVSNCNFTNNSAHNLGGGLFVNGGSVINCTFTNNKATSVGFGGGAYCGNKNPSNVVNCNFTNNTAHSGAGLYTNSQANVSWCNFINNTASSSGGGLMLTQQGNVTNCNFYNNTALTGPKSTNSGGGGIYFWKGGILLYSTFVNNTMSGSGDKVGGDVFYISDVVDGLVMNYNAIVTSPDDDNVILFRLKQNFDLDYNWWGFNNPNFENIIVHPGNPTYPTNIVVMNFTTEANASNNTLITKLNILNSSGNLISFEDWQKIPLRKVYYNFTNEDILTSDTISNISTSQTGLVTSKVDNQEITLELISNRIINIDVIGEIYCNSSVNITITLPEDARGSITLYVDDKNYTIILSDSQYGKFNYTISNLKEGNYTIKAVYNGDNNYNSSTSNTAVLRVSKISTELVLAINSSSVFVGSDVLVNVTVSPALNGSVIVSVGDDNHTVVISNGKGSLLLSNLANRTYSIKAIFEGNAVYINSTSNIVVLKVNKIPVGLVLAFNSSSIFVGSSVMVNVTASLNINSTVTVCVGSKNHTFTISNGKGSLILSNLANGTYSIKAVFNGNDKYINSTSNTETLFVNKIATSIVFDVNESIFVGDVAVVNVTVTPNLNTVVTVCVGSENYTVTISNGKGSLTLSDLANGTYSVKIVYTGDDKYVSFTTAVKSLVVSKVATDINLTVLSPIFVGDNVNIVVNMSEAINGNVIVSVNGKNTTVEVTGGNGLLVLSGLANGTYSVKVFYLGDEKYSSCESGVKSLLVNKIATSIEFDVNESIFVGDVAVVNITASLNINAAVTVCVGNENYTVTVSNGNGVLSLSGLGNGTYAVKVVYAGDDKYVNFTTDVKELIVNKIATAIEFDVNTSIKVGEIAVVNLTVFPSLNGSVIVYVDDNNYTVEVSNGKGLLTIANLAMATYSVKVVYGGDDKYVNFTTAAKYLAVGKVATDINLTVLSPIFVGDSVNIVVNMSEAINGNVIVSVNGKNTTVEVTGGNGLLVLSGLANGTYLIKAIYLGDEKYSSCESGVKSLLVNKIATHIEFNVNGSIKVGEIAIINITASPNLNTTLTVCVGIENYTVTVSNGKGSLTLSGLANGTYFVKIVYDGDDKYVNFTTGTKEVIVEKIATAVGVSVLSPIFVGDMAVITVTLSPGITSSVVVSVGDENHTVGINKGIAILHISNLDNGVYDIKAYYLGDDKYINSTSDIKTLTVNKITTSIDFDVNNSIYVDEIAVVNVTASPNLNTTATVCVGSQNHTITISNGKGSLSLPNLANGTYTIKVVYAGDDKYINFTTLTKTLTVNKIVPDINLTFSSPIFVGDTVNIAVNMSNDINGNVIISVDGKNRTIEINDGNGLLSLSNLANGTYSIKAVFSGDYKYSSVESNVKKLLVNKIATAIGVSVLSPIFVGDIALITVTLSSAITDSVVVSIDGNNQTLLVNGGTGTLHVSDLGYGSYDVKAYYLGDDKYVGSSSASETLFVNKITTTVEFDVNDSIKVGEIATVNITTTPNLNTTVTVCVGSENHTVTVSKGKGSLTLSDLTNGTYSVKVVYDGDDKYINFTTAAKSLTVSKIVPGINLTVSSPIYVGDMVNIVVNMSESINGNVIITVNGENNTVVITNGNGLLELSDLANGTYHVKVIYNGNNQYASAESEVKELLVNKIATTVSISVLTPIFVGDDALITVTLSSAITGSVVVNIDGNNQTVSVSDGSGTLSVSDLGYGSYDVKAYYLGDDKYINSSSDTATLIVNKITTSIDFDVNGSIYVGETAVVNVTTSPVINGTATVCVGSENHTINILNGKGLISISSLGNGTYSVKVVYEGDDKYINFTTATKLLMVNKIVSDINLTISSPVYVGDGVNISINMSGPINGSVIISINGKNTTVEITDGNGLLELSDLANGTYHVKAIYNGNNQYTSAESEIKELLVNKISTAVEVSLLSPIHVGDVALITVTLSSAITGSVVVSIDGNNQTVSVTDGTGTLYVSDLGYGSYDVKAFYLGDDKYINSTSDSETLVVNKIATALEFDVNGSIKVGETAIVNITATLNLNTTVTVCVGSKNYTVIISNGKGSLSLSDLTNGTYSIKVVYDGDEKYLNFTTANKFLVVAIVDFEVNLTVSSPIYVGDTARIIVNMSEPVNGNLIITVNGKNTTAEIINGNAVLDLTNLTNGTYFIQAIYEGDEKYSRFESEVKQLIVNKFTTDVDISVASLIYVGDMAVITVNMSPGINASVVVSIGSKNHTVSLTEGSGTLSVSDLGYGSYDVKAYYMGDDKYANSNSSTKTLVVNKISTTVEFDVNGSVYVGETATINITTSLNLNTTVTVCIGSQNHTVTISNGKGLLLLSDLANGTYSIKVIYNGDDKYINFTTASKSLMVNKKVSDINLTVPRSVYVGDVVNMIVNMSDAIDGSVIITINGKNTTIEITGGNGLLALSNLTNGTYSIQAIFTGDDKYCPVESDVKSLIVNKIATSIEFDVNSSIKVGETVFVNVTASPNLNTTANVCIGSKNYTVTISNGKGSLSLSDLANGAYYVKVVYPGDDKYLNFTTSTKSLVVSKITTDINLTVSSQIYVGDMVNIVVNMSEPVNGNVTVSINGENTTLGIVNGNGILSLSDLANGTYSIKAIFEGDDKYCPAESDTKSLLVNKITTAVEVSIAGSIYVEDIARITVNLYPGITASVIVSVGDKNHTVSVTDGIGTLNLSDLGYGSYEVKAYYLGDNKYINSTSESETLIVNKIATTFEFDVNGTIKVGDVAIVNITASPNINTTATVRVGSQNHIVTISNGKGYLPLSNLANGTYSIKIVYDGDDKYINFTTVAKLLMVNKIVSDINLTVPGSVHVGDTIKITVNMSEPVNGNVIVSINGENRTVEITNGNGVLTLSNLANGIYSVKAIYHGNNQYVSVESDAKSLLVNKIVTTVSVDVASPIYVGDVAVITVNLSSGITASVVVSVGSENHTVQVHEGIGTLNVPDLCNGTYEVKAYYLGGYKYVDSTSSTETLTVNKISTAVGVSVVSPIYVGDIAIITVTLSPDITSSVIVNFNGNNHTVSVKNGTGTLNIPDLDNGVYEVKAYYLGDGKYLNSTSGSEILFVNKIATSIGFDVNGSIKVGEVVTVNITVYPNLNTTVIVCVGSENHTITISNGKGELHISGLANGTHSVKVVYAGDYKYLNFTTSTKSIVVSKITTDINLTVLSPIYVGDSGNIAVNISEPVNGNVIVSVNGENTTVEITNGNGLLQLTDLANGTYYIKAIYNGDNQYLSSESDVEILLVNKIATTVDVDVVSPLYVGDIVRITVTLSLNITGSVVVNIGGNNHTVSVIEGTGTLQISDLDYGSYEVKAYYLGDDKYINSTSASKTLTVNKITTSIGFDVNGSIKVGETAVVNITATPNINTTVTVRVGSKNYTVTISNGKGELYISDLANGTYSVKVVYEGDDKYINFTTASKSLTVNKIVPVIDLTVANLVYVGDNVKIIVNMSEAINGNVVISVNGKNTTVELVSGRAALNLTDLANGTYSIQAIYEGDYRHVNAESDIKQLSVNKIPTTVGVSVVSPIYADDTAVITVKLSSNITTSVIISFNGNNQTINLKDGKTTFNISDLESGTYEIKVYYLGDDKYEASFDRALLTVLKQDLKINLTVSGSVYVGDTATITVNMSQPINGNVTVSVNGENITVGLVAGWAALNLTDLASGTYTVQAIYKSNTVEAESEVKSLTVNKIPAVLDIAVTTPINVGSSETIKINMNPKINATVNLQVGNNHYNVVITNGVGTQSVTGILSGTYSVRAVYSGDDKYTAVNSASKTLTVNKITTAVSVGVGDITVGENAIVNVTLTNGASGVVNINVGTTSVNITLSNGFAAATFSNLAAGTYGVNVVYYGDNTYASSIGNARFNVNKLIPTMNTTNKNNLLEVTLPSDAGGDVSLTVGGKVYGSLITNSKAVFDLSGFDTGNYNVVITYSGDSNYLSKTITDTVSVNNIVLTAANVTKYYGGSERFRVTLKDNNKPLANANIKITINGMVNEKTTNDNGAVSIAIGLNSGTYEVITEYGDIRVNSTVVVKNTVESFDFEKIYRNATQYRATFIDSNGNLLRNTEIELNINGILYKRTTKNSGVANMNINLNPGEYVVTAINPASKEMYTSIVRVISSIVDNHDITKYYRNATRYSLRVLSSDSSPAGSGEVVTLNINGMLYERKTNASGYINMNINLGPGTYIVTAQYNGLLASNTITVLNILKASDLKMSYRDGSGFRVNLVDGQGNNYAGQKITFNINGVFYTKTTNSQGIARLAINLISGEYIITSTYNGLSMSNKITIS